MFDPGVILWGEICILFKWKAGKSHFKCFKKHEWTVSTIYSSCHWKLLSLLHYSCDIAGFVSSNLTAAPCQSFMRYVRDTCTSFFSSKASRTTWGAGGPGYTGTTFLYSQSDCEFPNNCPRITAIVHDKCSSLIKIPSETPSDVAEEFPRRT